MATNPCPRCRGCGKIASGDEGAPWSDWENLPLKSAAAVLIGLVKPIPCPACGGSGERSREAVLEDALIALAADLEHFAQTNHQAHHGDDAATWRECDRGICPGLRRAHTRALVAVGKE